MKKRSFDLMKIRKIAEYQFELGIGEKLFPENVEIIHSRRTGRIRLILLDGKLIATLRPTNGLLALTIAGARRLASIVKPPILRVSVQEDVEEFVSKGKSVFAKHVVSADPNIRPQEEVIVTGRNGQILAVGRAMLTGREMLVFRRGVAIKVRKGSSEKYLAK